MSNYWLSGFRAHRNVYEGRLNRIFCDWKTGKIDCGTFEAICGKVGCDD